MIEQLGITEVDAVDVVLTATGMYLAFLVIVRLIGQRAIISLSTMDVVAVVALGAIIGRAILGDATTLAGGVIALVTLFLLQALVSSCRNVPWVRMFLTVPAVVLMVEGRAVENHLRKAHLTRTDVATRLREAGICDPAAEVACVILESTGNISILRRGRSIDPDLLAGVRGAELVPAHLLGAAGGEAA